jgi:hypothetical protein
MACYFNDVLEFSDKDMWSLSDDLAQELCLIPNRKRRGLVNRTLWESLRTSVIQGVLKKISSSGHSLFSAVQAARAIQQQNQANDHPMSSDVKTRVVYGRLKRAPKLPSKPALQSSESSTDDLSGSEESSSSGMEEADAEQANAGQENSNVSILGGNGTEEDDGECTDNNDITLTSKSKCNKASADVCIEIKLGKDKDKSKILLGGAVFQTAVSASTGARAASGGSANSPRSGPADPVSSWMRWDGERTNRANQDYQREREEMAMRDLLRHLARRQQHLARQQGQAQPPVYMRPVASAPNLTSVHGTPFGGSFLRLELDWRETHMAYLQHRSTTAQASSATLGNNISRGMTRPNSAASLRSNRHSHSRITRH